MLPPPEVWSVGPSRFTAFPTVGARLASWDLHLPGGRDRSVIPWPDYPAGTEPGSIRGGNPILFPFAGRSFHSGTIERWKDPHGEVRPMPRHGFARQGQFSLLAQDPGGFTAKLEPTAEDRLAYPGEYAFTVSYRFLPLGFVVTLSLENLGDQPLPWSAGHHFFFTIPWLPGTTRGDYRVITRARQAHYHATDGRLVPIHKADLPEPDALDTFDLGGTHWIDRIHTRLRGNQIRFGPKHGETDILMTIGREPVPTTDTALVTWTEAPESPFVCVEPWMGPPNAAAHRKGLHVVNPGAREDFTVRVDLE